MTHVLEHAASGRAKCRGCDDKIDKDELRFGERQPNPFGDGESTLWFHPLCGAYKRPQPFLEMLETLEGQEVEGISAEDIEAARALRGAAEFGVTHRRAPRINEASRAPTGRARCRSCRELIEKDTWRIGLVYFEEYRFQPSGFIHAGCAKDYFDTADIMPRILHFSPALDPGDLDELAAALTPAAS